MSFTRYTVNGIQSNGPTLTHVLEHILVYLFLKMRYTRIPAIWQYGHAWRNMMISQWITHIWGLGSNQQT